MKIGDHEFNQRVCRACGRHWVDVRNVTVVDVGKTGVACQGILTHSELIDYVAEREREDRGIDQAFSELGSR